jgi:putative tricarboxylic transport membrane protein
MQRRNFLRQLGVLPGIAAYSGVLVSTSLIAPPAHAQSFAKLSIFIPANPGGGWDTTGRALGAALQATKAASELEYENVGGKGGITGLQRFVEKFSGNPNALLVGGMVMVGSIALNKPAIDLARVVPLARLSGDYLVLVVPAASPIKDARAFVDTFKQQPTTLVISGGSAGGIDHLMVGMMARELRVAPADIRYAATASGADSLKALQEGRAQAAVAGYSEFKDAIASGQVRALGISAGQRKYNITPLGSAGVRVELSNWRGVFGAAGTSGEQQATLRNAVVNAAGSDVWQQALVKNSWEAKLMHGAPLADFIAREQSMARVLVHLLGLKAS